MPDTTPHQPRPRVLSGMRPTGPLHLGNYMGALKNWIDLQNQRDEHGQPVYDCFFFIADWHALTTDYADPSRLKQNVFEVALDFLSAGLDPARSTIFIQSHVPQHAELNLLLSMITPLSWLERVPTYKDQQEQLKEKDLATFGFLGYPLLQSADILLYRPHFVPVGQDQVAHVEITREIARRFNLLYRQEKETDLQHAWSTKGDPCSYEQRQFSKLLPEPQVLLTPSPKLPGTDGRKMSKSYGNSILLTDRLPVVLEKTHSMSKLGQRPLQTDPGDPELCPVGDLHRVFSEPNVDQHIRLGCTTATISCENCKEFAGLSIFRHTGPIQTEHDRLERNPDLVWQALDSGAERASVTAEQTMRELRAVTGLSRDRSGVRIDRSALPPLQRSDPRQLSQHKDWLNLDSKLLQRNLREFWRRDLVPLNAPLKADTEGLWLTPNNRRVFVAAEREQTLEDQVWSFRVKPRSYEVLVLLCLDKDLCLHDFVVPQKEYVKAWTGAKKESRSRNETEIEFTISAEPSGNHQKFWLFISGDPFEVTAYDGSRYPNTYNILT